MRLSSTHKVASMEKAAHRMQYLDCDDFWWCTLMGTPSKSGYTINSLVRGSPYFMAVARGIIHIHAHTSIVNRSAARPC